MSCRNAPGLCRRSDGLTPAGLSWLVVMAWVTVALAAPHPQTPTAAETAEPPPPATTDVYRIGPADVLEIDVYGEPDLSGEFTVAPDGTIVFPLIGQVVVAGLHVGQANHTITTLLERDYLYDAKVNVSVSQYRSQKIEILGSVSRPGTHFLEGPTRLLDALSRSGGMVPVGAAIKKGQSLRIVRSGANGEAESTIRVDLYELLVEGSEEANPVLRSGDVIYVSQGDDIHVVGEVKRPGSYPYEEGMTVLKAISLAGGATTRAARGKVIVRRIEDGREVRIKAPMEAQLEAEDIVEVPVGFW